VPGLVRAVLLRVLVVLVLLVCWDRAGSSPWCGPAVGCSTGRGRPLLLLFLLAGADSGAPAAAR
jgi:hypothetical protein